MSEADYCLLGEGYCRWCRYCIIKYKEDQRLTDDRLFGEIDWFEERERWISKVDSLERFIEYKGLIREYFEWIKER